MRIGFLEPGLRKFEVERRLAWAVDNGNLEAPGLPPATGKNLYH